MTKNIIYALAVTFLVASIQGCGNPLGDPKSSIDPGYGPEKKEPPSATGYEQISGSLVSQPSQSGQHITDATVGSSTKDIRLTTTRNKIVYLSVQGQLISK